MISLPDQPEGALIKLAGKIEDSVSIYIEDEKPKEKNHHPAERHFSDYFKLFPSLKNEKDGVLTFISALFMVFCLFIASVSNSLADFRNKNVGVSDTSSEFEYIPDVIIDSTKTWFNKTFNSENMGDKWLLATLLMVNALLLISRKKCPTMFRRCSYVTGTMYILRAMTINLTMLPTPMNQALQVGVKCMYRGEETFGNVMAHAFKIFSMQEVACGDVFFSGHTILYTVGAWVFITYQTSTIINVLVSLNSLIGMFFLISSTLHYTIDVVISFILTSLVWNIYHWGWKVQYFEDSYWAIFLRWIDDTRSKGQTDHSDYYNDPVNEKMKTNIY
jgi:hypothetical protein